MQFSSSTLVHVEQMRSQIKRYDNFDLFEPKTYERSEKRKKQS